MYGNTILLVYNSLNQWGNAPQASKIEKMDEMEKSVGAVKGYVKVLSWFSIINFVMLVAFILYSLGVFNF